VKNEIVKTFYYKYLHNSAALCALLSVLINFIIEAVSREVGIRMSGLSDGSPMTFLYNAFMIFVSFSVAYLVNGASSSM
jgi:hypothetical protein